MEFKHTKLYLEDYCDGCREIEPACDMMFYDMIAEVAITCSHAAKCAGINRHLDYVRKSKEVDHE